MTRDPTAALEELLTATVSAAGPGCALGIVAGGELRAAAYRGLANLEHRVPISACTVFHVASISKQFVAYAAALLDERRSLDLDAPIASVLDRFPFEAVSARQLVHHVSGLRDQWELLLLAGRQMEDVITTDEIIELVARQRDLNFPSGSSLAYSNTGYTLLGKLVEMTSGRGLGAFASEEIFAPLSMAASRFVNDHHEIVHRRADSYYRRRDGGHGRLALSYSTAGATSLNTTLADLARWTVHAMSPPVRGLLDRRITLNDGRLIEHAAGVVTRTCRGRVLLEHSGSDAGYRAHLAMFPDDGIAAIALANGAECPVYWLAHRAAGIVLDRIGAPLERTGNRRLTSNELIGLSGLYIDRFSGQTHEVGFADGRVVLDGTALEPVRSNVLAVRHEKPFELHVGQRLILRRVGMSDTSLDRCERWLPTASALEKFTGRFWSDELSVEWTISREGDRLTVEHPRWPAIPMTPTVSSSFSFAIPQTPQNTRVDIHFGPHRDDLSVTTRRAMRVRFRRLRSSSSRARGRVAERGAL